MSERKKPFVKIPKHAQKSRKEVVTRINALKQPSVEGQKLICCIFNITPLLCTQLLIFFDIKTLSLLACVNKQFSAHCFSSSVLRDLMQRTHPPNFIHLFSINADDQKKFLQQCYLLDPTNILSNRTKEQCERDLSLFVATYSSR